MSVRRGGLAASVTRAPDDTRPARTSGVRSTRVVRQEGLGTREDLPREHNAAVVEALLRPRARDDAGRGSVATLPQAASRSTPSSSASAAAGNRSRRSSAELRTSIRSTCRPRLRAQREGFAGMARDATWCARACREAHDPCRCREESLRDAIGEKHTHGPRGPPLVMFRRYGVQVDRATTIRGAGSSWNCEHLMLAQRRPVPEKPFIVRRVLWAR